MNETEALAQFARTVAAAADELARTLSDAPAGDRWDAISPPLGPRQRRILAMDLIETQRGMSAADVVKETGGPAHTRARSWRRSSAAACWSAFRARRPHASVWRPPIGRRAQ